MRRKYKRKSQDIQKRQERLDQAGSKSSVQKLLFDQKYLMRQTLGGKSISKKHLKSDHLEYIRYLLNQTCDL